MTPLSDLFARVEKATGPDARLDGELDALVDHENEQWPPRYTADVMYLQQITPRLGLDTGAVSIATLALMDKKLWRTVALLYAKCLLKALIAQEEGK